MAWLSREKMTETTLLIPDLQVPYHDEHFVDLVIEVIKDRKPDHLVQVGDFVDQPEPSRWNKGMAGEYATTLQGSFGQAEDIIDRIGRAFRKPLKNRHKPWHYKRGNHDERMEVYVQRYAPALGSLADLTIESQLHLDKHGVIYHRGFIDELVPGWIIAHGDEDQGSSRYPGARACNMARKYGVSVACGHTHSAGVVPYSFGFNGDLTTIFGMEVGHGMEVGSAHYLKAGYGNWQQAIGLLHNSGGSVVPELLYVVDGWAYSSGRWFSGLR